MPQLFLSPAVGAHLIRFEENTVPQSLAALLGDARSLNRIPALAISAALGKTTQILSIPDRIGPQIQAQMQKLQHPVGYQILAPASAAHELAHQLRAIANRLEHEAQGLP